MKNLYTAFPGRSTAPDANYPYGSAKNVVSAGDGTGTPWTKSIVDDIYGFFSRGMALAGLTPTNNSDTALVSQIHDAIRLSCGYPGMVVMHHMTTIPTGIRLLNLEGQGVLVSAYPDLAAACYVGDPNNPSAGAYYKADDEPGTSRNTAGVYLILPDARGRFARGEDIGATVDPGGAARLLGDGQDDAVQKHNHVVIGGSSPFVSESYGDPAGVYNVARQSSAGASTIEASAVQIGESISGSYSLITGVGRVSTETRPSNFQVQYAVWY